ncbi:unnamed protein product [Knipowitschia caucasica]|uniref:Heme-binding protein 2 n=1 Tax=Knipowitschia caucasica TaxID=637954 RepID=A0AAV2IY60_KNICA
MMICLAGLVSFLLVLTAEAQVGLTDENSLCKDTEQCLQHTTICNNTIYEVRRYESVKWVCTSFSAPNWMLGVGPAFWRVYNYLKDNNMGMSTSPGTVQKPADAPPNSWFSKFVNNPKLANLIPKMPEYTLCFLLPIEHQNNPPEPTDAKVEIVETEQRYVYVRAYNGSLTDESDQAKLLFNSINKKSYENARINALYNRPSMTQYIEVWVEANSTAQC